MENLTAYQLWQLEKKGNILPEHGPAEFENNSAMDAELAAATQYEESLLLNTF